MATVYLVEHQTLQKRFAAKVLANELASSTEARARFTAEAHAASQLDHENIVTISDFGITSDHRPFYVMELLRGQTLDERLGEGRMSIEEVVAVCVPVGRALAHAHGEGIVHRDVKPENIFLVQRSQGRWTVKVLDFGIAKTPATTRLTKTGQALGSPMFMAPEACLGEDVDHRADIYSYGVLLYLMLCGRLPFEDENLLRVLQMQVSSPLVPPRALVQSMSPELEGVIVRALAKDPKDRYPSMSALLLELEAALPVGSDRLLIEAQSGIKASATPFPGTLAIARPDSARMPRASQQLKTLDTRTVIVPTMKSRRRDVSVAVAVICIVAVAGAAIVWKQYYANADTPEPGEHVVMTPAPAPTAVQPAGSAADEPETAPPPTDEPVEIVSPPVEPGVRKADAVKPPARRVVKAATKGKARPPVRPVKGSTATATAPTPREEAPPAEVATVVEPVVVTPPPEPPPKVVAPTPPPVAAAPPKAGSLDATPVIAGLEVKGPLPGSVVRRGLERQLSALRACYRTAAKARNATPVAELSLTFEIDENSAAIHVGANGGFETLAGCATAAVSKIRVQQPPDVGTARVTVAIKFQPT